MKRVYPVVLTTFQTGFVAYAPDLEINTQGADLVEAIEMARDAIGLWGKSELDTGRELPERLDVKACPQSQPKATNCQRAQATYILL